MQEKTQKQQEYIRKTLKDIFAFLANIFLVLIVLSVVLGIILAYTHGTLAPFLRVLSFSIGMVCGSFIILSHHAWKNEGEKLLQATRAASLITLFFAITQLSEFFTRPADEILSFIPFMFSICFTIGILALFEKDTLPITDELAAQLIGTYVLWNIASTYSPTHPFFICGVVLFLLYFLFARREQVMGTIMRGISVFSLIAYLLVTFTYQLLLTAKPILGIPEPPLTFNHVLLMFTLGTFFCYTLLYGLHVFSVVFRLNPLVLFSPKLRKETSQDITNTLKRFSYSFNPRQYKATTMSTSILLLLIVLYTNTKVGPFLSPLTITALTVILATYRPRKQVVVLRT